MPKRTDIKKIMIIGSGPIIISQACEFDYSGTQACKALKEEGYQVVLINSNPATIMTDPELADSTYIEPITPEAVSEIIKKERPDALLPTLGGQTGLNTAIKVAETGILDEYGVEMIAASIDVIKKAEDRELFRAAMENIGLKVPESGFAHSVQEARDIVKEIGFPIIIRPSFTLGGTGGGVAYNWDDLEELAKSGLDNSLIDQVMLEKSLLGWKEFELEVMRDKADNVVIICSIENLDPMGVHTGDSITVAPAQTLTDKEYQKLRNASIDIIREIGVETGGSNIQFAVNPADGDIMVIEMNPRVSRSSALASKATGFPIARIAAKLAIGYTLDELQNDITRETLASFEPVIDYCVVKIPRFTFEKFPGSVDALTTSMKSVGETMAIGRTFKEALNKAIRSLETGYISLNKHGEEIEGKEEIAAFLATPNSKRLYYVAKALCNNFSIKEIVELTSIDQWFIHQIIDILEFENELQEYFSGFSITGDKDDETYMKILKKAKEYGISDRRIAELAGGKEFEVREHRKGYGIKAVYRLVDTCAAEFEAYTPYYYSTYETENEVRSGTKEKIIILGGGPNRIGQGIEFDYCCVHSAFAVREYNYEAIMVNSNPETVSTDYDTSDQLYFEPLTLEDVLNIVEQEKPKGVIVQFGGQTPLNLAMPLQKAGVPILGTSPDSIDRAEDRERFKAIVDKLNLRQPENGIATDIEGAVAIADKIGYPVIVRPSYVLGGRAMEIVYDKNDLINYTKTAVMASPEHPILIDRFLEGAIEMDVDAICDGHRTLVAGIMEHIEEAGIHSGDSACVIPPYSLAPEIISEVKKQTDSLARELNVIGLMNIQYAIKDDKVYLLEVNPRASRTIPFVSKATNIPLAKIATKVMLGATLDELEMPLDITHKIISIKEAVFPFNRFPGVDTLLGPEMRSTGEVMGIDKTFGMAFAKSQIAAGMLLPLKGQVFISVKDSDKNAILPTARIFQEMGFSICATSGTSKLFSEKGILNKRVKKVREGRPHVVDHIKNGEIQLVINTTAGKTTTSESYSIRRSALDFNIPYTTTIASARAIAAAILALRSKKFTVKSLQEYHTI